MDSFSNLSPHLTKEKAMMFSPLELAYVGDTVFDLMVRSSLILQGGTIKALHRSAVQKVNAVAQAQAVKGILPLLTEEENAIYKRGRNAHSKHSAPKAASVIDYQMSTGLEALFGYLFLIADFERIKTLYQALGKDTDNASSNP